MVWGLMTWTGIEKLELLMELWTLRFMSTFSVKSPGLNLKMQIGKHFTIQQDTTPSICQRTQKSFHPEAN